MRFTLMPMTACFAIRGRPAQVAHGDAAKGAATREPNLGVSGALDRPGLDAAQRWNQTSPTRTRLLRASHSCGPGGALNRSVGARR